MNMRKKNKGFTLLEVVITLLIVAIIASFAYPAYRKNVLKTNRSDAKTKLLEVMQREERYYSEKNTYATDLTLLGYSASPVLSDNSLYSVSAAAGNNDITSQVILTAAPQGKQTQDTTCNSFILSSLGQKSVSTGSTSCW